MSDLNSQIYYLDTDCFEGIPVISYSRKEAIASGQQMLFEGKEAKAFTDMGYKHPVYVTKSVTNLIETALKANKSVSKDLIIYDLSWMSRMGKVEQGYDYAKFLCILPTESNPQEGEEMDFLIQVGATDLDDPTPCMTLMTSSDR